MKGTSTMTLLETVSAPARPSARLDGVSTAPCLLEAARRVLERSGSDALSLESVSREAGKEQSAGSLPLHRQGRSGSGADRLVDLRIAFMEFRDRVEDLPGGAERLCGATQHQLCTQAHLPVSPAAVRCAWHVLDDSRMRQRIRAFYADYGRLVAGTLRDGKLSAETQGFARSSPWRLRMALLFKASQTPTLSTSAGRSHCGLRSLRPFCAAARRPATPFRLPGVT